MGRNDSAAWKGANPSKLRSLGRWQPQAAELQVPVLRSKCCLIWGLGKVLKGLCHLVSSGTSQLPPLCVTSFSAVVENMSRALLHPSDNSGWHQVGFLGGGRGGDHLASFGQCFLCISRRCCMCTPAGVSWWQHHEGPGLVRCLV